MAKLAVMPSIGVEGLTFQPQREDLVAPETSGRMGGVQIGWPRWSLSMNLANLEFPVADEWIAFYRSRRGAQRMFLGYDLSRPYPTAHCKGFRNMLTVSGTPFMGAAGAWTQSVDAQGDAVLTLEGVPSGLKLGRGDYIGFKWDSVDPDDIGADRRFLVAVTTGSQADADGTISVVVEPSVHDVVPAGAVAHLDNPMCLMKLLDDTKMPRIVISHAEAGGVISAVQVTLP
ncbi:hypothetical protein N6H05_09945 [Sphingobium sp. WTD-1]|uniref:hypothetical protein n=1 Tax=Sphingobium sp. WTD-1 TaxID=2979467 RepID=UPI0024DE3931|nr:hypothetical protein [Sphingobium sp. WTD-1]WIA58089.1 hypothetical protein N6H05_09945 [Sphingobium sp. WTD-1]